jgi:hypothetical protein
MPAIFSPKKLFTAVLVLVLILLGPVPLLPPELLVKQTQQLLGGEEKIAYLVSTIGFQALYYGLIGGLTGVSLTRFGSRRARLVQLALAPLALVSLRSLVYLLNSGDFPVGTNSAVAITACFFGVAAGVALLYRQWQPLLIVTAVTGLIGAWTFLGGISNVTRKATLERLQRLGASASQLPNGDERLPAIIKNLFAPLQGENTSADRLAANRSAILAMGIAVGDESFAKFARIQIDGPLLQQLLQVRNGTTLNGRADWPRHFALSSAIAVATHPFVSNASGLLKEELDSLSGGSGFSFGDLLADRAGIRFANAATRSRDSAQAFAERAATEFQAAVLYPAQADFPENLNAEKFRQTIGLVGSPRYQELIREIEQRLDNCEWLIGY